MIQYCNNEDKVSKIQREKDSVMVDFYVAYDKLAQFKTADELADFFRHEGVKGFMHERRTCPIANWMKMQTGLEISAASDIVDLTPIVNGDGTLNEAATSSRAMATYAMVGFMQNFDNCHYPSLVDERDCGWDI